MSEYFSERLKEQKLFLAPLAGVSDAAFRQSVRECGAESVFAVTEMISAKGLYYNNKKTLDLAHFYEGEKNTGVQLFGRDEAALSFCVEKYINAHPCAFIDLNFGCPVKKVVSNGEGSALLGDIKKLSSVAKAVVACSKKPVSAKIRLGIDSANINAPQVAQALEDAGVSLVAVHLRTAKQMYSGKCDYEYVEKIKRNVSIPVVANGDITTPEEALKVLRETPADGIMIGRGAMCDPFIFRNINAYLLTNSYDKASVRELFSHMRRHLFLLELYKGHKVAIRQFRTHFASYTKGLKDSCSMRARLNKTESMEGLRELLSAYEDLLDK